MSVVSPPRQPAGSVRRQRLVLVALFAPFLGIGIVLWLLLPGVVASPSYSTVDFRHETALRPTYWSSHTASVGGYLSPLRCDASPCEPMVLTGADLAGQILNQDNLPPDAILVGIQPESGWHTALRRLLPRFLAAPLTAATSPGRWMKVTGSIANGYSGHGPPTLIPIAL